MKIENLKIDFPEIEGWSKFQEEYAEDLRERYVKDHMERFLEIQEKMSEQLDCIDLNDSDTDFWLDEKLSREERCVLTVSLAAGLIAVLKKGHRVVEGRKG